MVVSSKASDVTASGKGMAVGAGGATPRSFLVRNIDNVNVQLRRARGGLLAVWDLLEYKRRTGMTNIIVNRRDNPKTVRIVPASSRSRYFKAGGFVIEHFRGMGL